MNFAVHNLELPVRLRMERPFDEDELLDFCRENDLLRIEQEPTGELFIMSPTGGETGGAEIWIAAQLLNWSGKDGRGRVFGSSTGFRLPNGSMRSPDACWVHSGRWEALSREQRRRFVPLCPDFVVELRSPSDRLKATQAKMREWVANGAELAWLIDSERKAVEIYRKNAEEPQVLLSAAQVEGEDPVKGFALDLNPIWEAM